MPLLMSGSADLHGSTLNYIKDGGDFTRDNLRRPQHPFRHSRTRHVRDPERHLYHGLFRASGATFLGLCRLLPWLPFGSRTLEAAEHLHFHARFDRCRRRRPDASTRRDREFGSLDPELDVIRPADPEETAGAFVAAMQRTDGPTFLALTRQAVPMLNEIDVNLRREGVLRGGYIAKQETGKLDLISFRVAANCSMP